jgi:hypothetical protein
MFVRSLLLTFVATATAVMATCPEKPTWRTDRVRLAGVLKKKEGLSREEFLEHWLAHGELFKTTEMAKSVLKYEEVRHVIWV